MRTTSNAAPKVKLPEKPKFRSLANVAASAFQLPYILEKNSSDPDNIDYATDVVVGLGHLKYKSLQTYSAVHGENLQVSVSKCIWFLFAAYINSPGYKASKKDDATDLEQSFDLTQHKDDAGNTFIATPFGELYGDPQDYILKVAIFILCQYGRIVAASGDGVYEYIPITEDEIANILDPQMIFDVTEDGTPYLLEIFELSGLWDAKKVNEQLDEKVEAKN